MTSSPRDNYRTALLIGLCCLAIYNANRRAIPAGDTYPARYLPFAILEHQTVYFNPLAKVVTQGRGSSAFWVFQWPDGRMVSLYPIVTPVLVTPLYVPAVVYLRQHGWTDARLDHVAKVMEKVTASLLAALSAALLYLLLRRRTTTRNALLLTVAYALGTTTWVISSQALWQHGTAQVLIILVLLLLTGPFTAPRAIAVGLLCGLITANRPPDAILAAALGGYAFFVWAGRQRAILLATSAALPLLVVFSYNQQVAGNIGGGYGLIGLVRFFSKPLLPGIAGLLLSPTHGLLVFSPFLLFLLAAWRYPPLRRDERILSMAMGVAIVVQLLLYAKIDWRGGLSWGPRYLTDLTPFLIWLLVPVVDQLRGLRRALFVLAVSVSIVIEAIGAFAYSDWVDNPIYATGGAREMEAAWQWKNAPFLSSLKRGPAAPEWGNEPSGSFDGIETAGRQTSVITAGEPIAATGWALAGDDTPWQVAVVINGHPAGVAHTFTDRPDVRAVVKDAEPAGWRIPIDTSRLAEGEHTLTAFVWPVEMGEGYYLQERKLTVRQAAR